MVNPLDFQFNRRIASIGEFKFVAGGETHEMGVAICIPGILAERGDLHRVWGSDFMSFYFKEEVIKSSCRNELNVTALILPQVMGECEANNT